MHPCPRMAEVGHGPGSPFKLPTESEWRKDNTCSWCGGLNPDEALSRIEDGERISVTDKNYKIYMSENHQKVYFQHFTEDHMKKFIELMNSGRVRYMADIGFGRNLPYFIKISNS